MLQLNENDYSMAEFTSKLSGIILKKAELENNFAAVYSKVFERMNQLQAANNDELLFVLGEIGG